MDLDKIAVEENEDLDNIESEDEPELDTEDKPAETANPVALRAPSAHQQMQTAPAQLLPAEPNARREIIFKIKRYYARFPHLRDDLPLDLNALDDIPDLERTLDEIRLIMSNKKVASIPQIMAATGLAAIEGLSVYTPLKLQGLSKLSQNQEFIDLVDEWAIENGSYRYIPASQRLLYMVAMTSLQLHCVNTERELKAHEVQMSAKREMLAKRETLANGETLEEPKAHELKAHEVQVPGSEPGAANQKPAEHKVKKLQDLDNMVL